MPLKLSAGISRKMGLPNYGSLGAVCQVELELDGSLLEHEQEAFAHHVRQCYAACARAVDEELERQQAAMVADQQQTMETQTEGGQTSPDGNGNGNGNGSAAARADANGHDVQRASARQIEYARVLAGQIRGLGLRRLETFCQALLTKPLAELTGADASHLIDTLKSIRAGRLALAGILNGES
jgi:hypothetical protein